MPSGAPSSTGSRLRVDLASGRIYEWYAAGSTWRTLAQGIDIVAGQMTNFYVESTGTYTIILNVKSALAASTQYTLRFQFLGY